MADYSIPDLQGYFDNTSSLDPSLFNLGGTEVAGLAGGAAGSTSGLLFDTMTGQYVSPQQASLLDPSWDRNMLSGLSGSTSGYVDSTPGPGSDPAKSGGYDLNSLVKLLGGAAGLGAAGLGAAGIAQGMGGRQPGTSTEGTSTQGINRTTQVQPGPMSPEMNYLYSQMGGPGYGGLQGQAGHNLALNMGPAGLQNQQAGILGQLYGNAPNADPYLNQQLMQNAYGMSQGGLPSLTPQLQQQVGDIYGAQWNNINRYLEDYMTQMRDQMNNQGWEGGSYDVLRQGPGQAMFAPALREATRQQGLLAGQAAQSSLNLAQQLPQQALQLGSGVLGQQLGANQNQQAIAGAFNTPIGQNNAFNLGLLGQMNKNPSTMTTDTANISNANNSTNQLPPMTGMQGFQNGTQILGMLGGLAGGTQAPQPYPAYSNSLGT